MINSTGNLSIDRTSSTNDILNGKLNGSVTSTINADGSAIFDGSIESKNNFFVKAQADDQTCFRVTDLSGGTIRTNLRGDGGAEFASTVKIGNPSNPEIKLTGSGNATFAGDLSTGTFSPGSTTTTGTSVLASGQINVQQVQW